MFADGVAHEFDHQQRLAHPRAAEEADLTATGVGGQQVNGFDAGDERLYDHSLLAQRR